MEAHRSPPEVVLAILVLLVFVSCFARAQNNPLRNDTERSALFDLRSSLGLRAKDWPRRSEPCWNWTGVACQNGRVVGISVSGLQRTHAGRVNPQFAVDSLANLSLLATFNSSGFELPGSIPDWLGQSLSALQVLDLRSASVKGPIPQSLGSLGTLSLRFLDVSGNNFTGVLANLSWNVNSTNTMFNLSNNLFYGALPTPLGKFSLIDLSEDCRLFYAERNLSFDNFGAPSPAQPPLPGSSTNSSKRWIFILVGLFGGLGRSPLPAKVSINFSGVGDLFTYEQILCYTDGFSEINLIKHGHSGDLFRGILESGAPVVVKRVDLRALKKESYMMELDVLNKVSHMRLVPLLGHCLEHDSEKLLVYKYMPNGDLSNSLYRVTNLEDDNLQSLDWITRLKIAIGAAEGLSYLHHECSPPLVHRDVQASSILLDDKFEVRLGSLSEVCAQEGDSHQNVITKLLRKPQTSEQGSSGLLSATCAYDVYCFGKVLLELVTGKLGISKSDDATTRDMGHGNCGQVMP
ncbi:unnamed protein product, partial [Vitis vinifera]